MNRLLCQNTKHYLISLASVVRGLLVLRRSMATPQRWAIALHGGAGVIQKDINATRRAAYIQGLKDALQTGVDALKRSMNIVIWLFFFFFSQKNVPEVGNRRARN